MPVRCFADTGSSVFVPSTVNEQARCELAVQPIRLGKLRLEPLVFLFKSQHFFAFWPLIFERLPPACEKPFIRKSEIFMQNA